MSKTKRKNFVIIDHEVTFNSDFSNSMLGVYSVLKAHERNGTCWPSIKTIMDARGMSKNSVIKALKDLKTSGYIKITNRNSSKKHMSNIYTICPVAKNEKSRTQYSKFENAEDEVAPFLPFASTVIVSAQKMTPNTMAAAVNSVIDQVVQTQEEVVQNLNRNETEEIQEHKNVTEAASTCEPVVLSRNFKKEAVNIIETWNSKPESIPVLPSKFLRLMYQIIAQLKKGLTEEEVMKAMDNYFTIKSDQEKYFYSVNFTLAGFIFGGMARFLESAKPLQQGNFRFQRKSKPVVEACSDWTEMISKYGTPEQKIDFGVA